MTNHFNKRVLLLAVYAVVGGVYLWAAVLQMQAVNLHPAAGGQYPYLVHAQGIAREGLTRYLDDRNRMPLVPAVLSALYTPNAHDFFARAKWFGLVSSFLVLVAIGVLAHRVLPTAAAVAVTAAAVFGLAPERATIVQAELPFYALFFLSCVLLWRLLVRPDLRWAVAAGAVLAAAYHTKASVLPLAAAYAVAGVVQAVARRPAREGDAAGAGARGVACVAVVMGVFLLACGPYLLESQRRFGHLFYNVNSHVVMWSDSWREAQAFLERRGTAADANLSVPDEAAPGALRYWQTHTAGQVRARLTTGLGELGRMALRSPYGWFLFATLGLAGLRCARRRHGLARLVSDHRVAAGFAVCTTCGYLLLYAWYVQVAYGDRFLQSLLLPLMAGGLLLSDRLSAAVPHEPGRTGLRGGAVAILASVIVVSGMWHCMANGGRATAQFVQFFYNECRELEHAPRGQLLGEDPRFDGRAQADEGYAAVLRLDDAFGPAWLGRGYLRLQAGRPVEALEFMQRAVTTLPESADARNGLGAALLEGGQAEAAVEEFRRATVMQRSHVPAWQNLCAALGRLNRWQEAESAAAELTTIDPRAGAWTRDALARWRGGEIEGR